jgi:hypothetical protein
MNRPFDRDAVGVTQPYPKMTPEASAAWNTWATGLAERVASVKITALQKQMVDRRCSASSRMRGAKCGSCATE